MPKSGGSVTRRPATRLVHTIGVIKWLALSLIAFGVLGGTLFGLSRGDFAGAISLIVWVYGAVAALVVYVFMGWLQQTLHMLVGIARNTAKDDWLSRL
jgi:hypothetical protein